MEIFKLFGSIFIDDKGANDSLEQVDGKAKKTGLTMGGMIGTAAKWGAGIVAGAAAAGAGMLALVSKTSDVASEINDLNVRTGISTDRLQELKFIAGQTGVDFGAIEKSVAKLTMSMGKADEEGKGMSIAFEQLGVSTKNADGSLRSAADVFDESILKLSGMTNETERNVLAMQIFGKGANELVPMLDAGAEGMAGMSQKAHDLGLVMSEEAVAASDEFGDTMDALTASFGGIGMQIGTLLMPAFQGFADWVIAHMPEIQNGIQTAVDVVTGLFNGLAKAVSWVSDNSDILLPIIIGLTAAITAQAIINTVVGLYQKWSAITKTQTALQWLLNLALNANPLGLVALAIGALIAAGVLLYQNWDTVKEKLGQLWDWMQDIGGRIKTFFTGVFKELVDGFKWYVNQYIKAINFLINGLNKIKINVPKWVEDATGMSDFGINIPLIPYLEKGTDDFAGGMAIVGERGRELVNLPRHSQVIPNRETEDMLRNSDDNRTPEYIQTNVYLDGEKIAEVVSTRQERNKRRIGRGLGYT